MPKPINSENRGKLRDNSVQGAVAFDSETGEPAYLETSDFSGNGGGTAVPTIDNIPLTDDSDTIFFMRVDSETPPNITYWNLDGTSYTPTTGIRPAYNGTVNVDGNVEITNDVGNPIPVNGTITSEISTTNWTNASGTITTGGVAQNAIAADANGYHFFIQNNSAGDLWINTNATAVQSQPSIKLTSGDSYETPDSLKVTGDLSIIGATTGQAFSARKW